MAKPKQIIRPEDITICESTQQMISKARRDGVELFFDRAEEMKPCPIGADSACCKHCSMGPCRMNPTDPYKRVGVCGASIDTIAARNFGRMVAAGTAAHTDHGMAMLELFRGVIEGTITDFQIKDHLKLGEVAASLDIATDGREIMEIAADVYRELEKTYTQVEGEIPLVKRVPAKTLETWRREGIVPRGAMREIMEMMHRTAIGVDQDYENLTKQISRTALADGWGGSMVSTDISDILFGTPSPVEITVDMGVLKEDQVNIIVHGHEPNLLEAMMVSTAAPSLQQMAAEAGAKGINLVGMCCSGLEVLSRHGIPHAGNFSSTEAALVTGAVDAMTVDIQCIKQDLHKVAGCYDTVFVTTNYRAKIEGALHIELDEHDPLKCTDEIVIKAISRFKNRSHPIEIPRRVGRGVHGFSHEYIKYMLGGSFRGGYEPLNDNIINGRIRGVAGVVGCTNPRSKQDFSHVELVKELIKNDVLVVQTGCSQVALEGLKRQMERAGRCGPGRSLRDRRYPAGARARVLCRQQPHFDGGGRDGQDRRPRRIDLRPAGGRLRTGVDERKGHCHRPVFRGIGGFYRVRAHLPDHQGDQVREAAFRGVGGQGTRHLGLCRQSLRDGPADDRPYRQKAPGARHRHSPGTGTVRYGRPPGTGRQRVTHYRPTVFFASRGETVGTDAGQELMMMKKIFSGIYSWDGKKHDERAPIAWFPGSYHLHICEMERGANKRFVRHICHDFSLSVDRVLWVERSRLPATGDYQVIVFTKSGRLAGQDFYRVSKRSPSGAELHVIEQAAPEPAAVAALSLKQQA